MKSTAKHQYSLYGLRVAADRPIPALPALPPLTPIDLEIWLGARPPWLEALPEGARRERYISPYRDSRGLPALTVWELVANDFFCLSYSDGTDFYVNRAASQVWTTWPGNLTLEDMATYLLGPVMGFILRQRGIVCLHASCVAANERAIALLGPPGAGKSTTAAAFAQRGCAVLSDDLVPLRETGYGFFVSPGYPRLCLWPEATGSLYGSPSALPALTPNWEKQYLDLNGEGGRFQQSPLPLGAIYVLRNRSGEPDAPRIEEVSRATGLLDLVANTFMNYLLDRELRASEFAVLGRVAAGIPVRRVYPHQDPARLRKLCEVILDDIHILANASCKTAAAAGKS